MATANIVVEVDGTLTAVFEKLSDHARLDEISAPVKQAFLEAPGVPAPNGLGAIRRLRFSGTWMIEKVVAWHPPLDGADVIGYDYKVIGGGPPIADHLGTIRVTAIDEKRCRIEWVIFLKCPLWAGGEIAAYLSCRSMQSAIGKSVLEAFQ